MELIIGLGLAVLGIIAAAASRQLADEFKAWTPWIIERLIKRAVRKLPEDWRDRFEEEWLSHIHETPGEVGKLMAALGFLFAARQMSSPIIIPRRFLDILAALVSLFFVGPLLLWIAIAIKVEDGGPIFVAGAIRGPNGRQSFSQFRTISLGATAGHTRVGRFIRSVGLDKLPGLINVLRGEATFRSDRERFALLSLFLAFVGFVVALAVAG
jgi:hypothetical protein